MRSPVPSQRPDLSAVTRQPVFDQDYLSVVEFLTELPLKTKTDRSSFFSGLTKRLFSVAEETVAVQLAPLLLSRLVLLDETAKKMFLPNMLTCYQGIFALHPNNVRVDNFILVFLSIGDARPDYSDNPGSVNALLSEHLFKEQVIPILLRIFYVREFQIRSVLLK